MNKRIEFVKTIVHGDEELRQELLLGVLRNILYGNEHFTGPVDILKQHNRDIYYVVGGPLDLREKWTDAHLRGDERALLEIVPLEEVMGRLTNMPDWWEGAWKQCLERRAELFKRHNESKDAVTADQHRAARWNKRSSS